MAGGDSCLQLVGPWVLLTERLDKERLPFVDEAAVPLRPILVGQRDELPGVACACRCAGGCEQDQREQPGDFFVAWYELVQPPGQPLRLVAQVGADDRV